MTRTAALDIAVLASNRLQPIVAAVLCLMAAQLLAAACTPEPATPSPMRGDTAAQNVSVAVLRHQ